MSTEPASAPSSDSTPLENEATASPAMTGHANRAAEQSNAQRAAESGGRIPEFEEVTERVVARLDTNSDRLHEVCVPVWAELGRVEMLIGDLLQLGEGSVVRLDRSVGDPVDLISQGVKLARGEVIVVDDCFAIRIRDIVSGK